MAAFTTPKVPTPRARRVYESGLALRAASARIDRASMSLPAADRSGQSIRSELRQLDRGAQLDLVENLGKARIVDPRGMSCASWASAASWCARQRCRSAAPRRSVVESIEQAIAARHGAAAAAERVPPLPERQQSVDAPRPSLAPVSRLRRWRVRRRRPDRSRDRRRHSRSSPSLRRAGATATVSIRSCMAASDGAVSRLRMD